MNAAYLSEDELAHELQIREITLTKSATLEEGRRALRTRLRGEATGTDFVPRTTSGDVMEEYRKCEDKYKTLSGIPLAERGGNGKRFHTKLLHLKLRLERLNNTIPAHSNLRSNINEILNNINSSINPTLVVSDNEISEHGNLSKTATSVLSDKTNSDRTQITIPLLDSAGFNPEILTLRTTTGAIPKKKPVSKDASRVLDLKSFGSSSDSDSDKELNPTFHESLADPLPGRSSSIPQIERYRGSRRVYPIYKWKIVFRGDSKGISLNDFLQQIRLLSRTESVSDKELLRGAYYLFEGPAKIWFRATCEKFFTWEQLVQSLKFEFLPADHDYWLLREIDQRLQGKEENFSLYLAQMELYFKNLIEPISENQKLKTIIRNLQPFYLEKLPIVDINTISQLTIYCKKIEDLRYNLNRRSNVNRSVLEPSLNKPNKQPRTFAVEQNPLPELISMKIEDNTQNSKDSANSLVEKSLTCWNCLQKGHGFPACPQKKVKVFCYKCGKIGFVLSTCPKCSLSKSGNDQ